ncbi:ATP-binding cassette domain-containing protein [Gordonia pseudamarae]|jgi:putative ATP-binding cassette transporter|uniref:ATP-binding cassette domain-containing protein n=1 Tax=Gordonia pseudamarae TaxID=2831662 RepID=A0ABX6IE82_9ACTN|nr:MULTISPECIES: ATP-binding cassette domain-containing protein [Gordonia]MBD0021482.1 ATP-binding cassette domain-containing protein [Gordonia sp. (in: high G+C Gram-positive bacteria)]QHN25215.1 ATP-binding cassette domain-containing protein [Gordonia pseudamarae]QHN34147.1 ATP-binding cassette domain-containing protein [Gordonia pseudamarae]
MALLRFLVSVSWRGIAFAVVAGLIGGAANAFLVTQINSVISPKPDVHGNWVTFAATALVVLITGLASQVILTRLAQDAIYRLRASLGSGVIAAPLEHLERLGAHRLMATLTEDVRTLSQAVAAIPSVCIDAATIVGCLTYLAIISPTIFAVQVGATLLSILCVELLATRVRELYRQARETDDELLRSFGSVTHGIKELKMHRDRRIDFMNRHLLGSARELRDKNVTAGIRFSYAQGLGQLTQLATMALILFGLAAAMKLPLEQMIGYVLVTTFLSMPMQNIMHRIPDLLRGDVALKKIRMMELSMETPHDETALGGGDRLPVTAARIELADVNYSYLGDQLPAAPMGPPPGPRGAGGPDQRDPERAEHPRPEHPRPGHTGPDGRGLPHMPPPGMPPQVSGAGERAGFHLGPMNLVLQPGQVTFVVGGNGSGKSTLAKLLSGLYLPQSGTMSLNGEPIGHHNIEWFRHATSAIFTDFHLFEDFFGYLRPGIDDEVNRLLQQLQIAHKVSVHDGKLSSIALSQGQRKRLALVTALLEDRPVYLFDEWAADQEPQFRETFYHEILAELRRRGKTVIVITHDDRYFHLADQLVKLDFGSQETPVPEAASYAR